MPRAWPFHLIAISLLVFSALTLAPLLSQNHQSPPNSNNSKTFDLPIAIGQDILGIRVPLYNEGNTLIALFEAELARKLSEKELIVQNVTLELYDDVRRKLVVRSPHSTFFTDTQTISTNSGITITRDDFSVQGQNADFDIQKQLLTLHGDCTMTIQMKDEFQP